MREIIDQADFHLNWVSGNKLIYILFLCHIAHTYKSVVPLFTFVGLKDVTLVSQAAREVDAPMPILSTLIDR